jgi:hypothetical protein
MGMDLIGFIVKGPITFSSEQIKAAESKVVAALKYLKSEEGDPDTTYEWGHWDDLEMHLGLPLEGECLNARAKKIVAEFVEWWKEGDRCTHWIYDPDDRQKKIVFTGESTWGDTPDNDGFRLCEIVSAAAFGKELGLNL